MLVGVLALQGAFREHQYSLEACGVKTRQIRKKTQLKALDALVIPGGESTTMGKLLVQYDLMEPIIELGRGGLPIFGTCAGLIMLAREINNSDQPRLGLMDIKVERNAFGRQIHSFETDLNIPVLGEQPFRAVFIRAPYVMEVFAGTEVLATFENKIVCVRQNNLLGAAFHPELTKDLRLHRYFLDQVCNEQK